MRRGWTRSPSLRTAGDGRLRLKLEQLLVEVSLAGAGALGAGGDPDATGEPGGARAALVRRKFGRAPSADDVARAVGVSGAHLRRLFAEAGHASPREEMARLRMEAAQRCLREGWKLERVAQFLGFSEASAFSRAFSATCGVSPTAWLRREAGRDEGSACECAASTERRKSPWRTKPSRAGGVGRVLARSGDRRA